jgi:FkbM family methyltransferase
MLRYRIRIFRDLLKFDNPLQILLNRGLFGRTALTVYRYRGITALVDHSCGDQDGVKACLVPGLYDPFLEGIIPTLSGKPATILDLGANTGGFALALLVHGCEIERGVAVELNPLTCTRLAVNLAQNGLHGKVHVLNGAACGRSGDLQVCLSGGSVSDSIVLSAEGGKKITVPGYTIDEITTTYFKEPSEIDICKIDIEGAEYDLLASPHCASLSRCRWILIEIHQIDGHKPAAVVAALEGMGFTAVPPLRPAVENNVYLFRRIRPAPSSSAQPL